VAKHYLQVLSHVLSVHISSHTPLYQPPAHLINMANNAPPGPPSSGNTNINTNTNTNNTNTIPTLSLLDIVASPESAAALKAMIENSPGHSYIKPDLSDVNLLKVFVLDGSDDSVIEYLEARTNGDAGVYRRGLYGEGGSERVSEMG
jgi:hypothetical protein